MHVCSNDICITFIEHGTSHKVTLWQLAELFHECMYTRVFFWLGVQDNPHRQAFQNGITKHSQDLLHLRILRGVDAFQSTVIGLFLVAAMRA